MKFVYSSAILSAVLSVVLGCAPGSSNTNNSTEQVNIVGGQIADPTNPQARGVVGLWKSGMRKPFCTGTIISNYHVLTAAHCLVDEAAAAGVSVQTFARTMTISFIPTYNSRKKKLVVASVGVATAAAHPQYNAVIESRQELTTVPNADVAVVTLAQPIPRYAKVIRMLSKNSLTAGTKISIYGHGQGNRSSKSKAGYPNFLSSAIMNPLINPTQFAYGSRSDRSICHGDSGGPAFITARNGEPYVVGVTSLANAATCSQASMGVSTSVPVVYRWIVQQM